MMHSFVFDDKWSTDYGVYISGSGTFDAPVRAYTEVKIPGRMGGLLLSDSQVDNLDITYPAFIIKDFDRNFSNFKNAMMSSVGYKILEDDYDIEHYREAYFKGAIKPTMQRNLRAGQFNVTFTCKPQRWLRTGQKSTVIAESGYTITNPTAQKAKPLLTVTGSGTVQIGNVTLTVALPSGTTGVIIDCDICEAYTSNLLPMNQYVTSSGIGFPELMPGDNTIVFTVSGLAITPRWYEI